MTEEVLHRNDSGFFTGLPMGSILGAGAVYLTMTKSGRKMAHALLNAAEEIGEKGEEYYSELTGEPGKSTKESVSKTKIKTLIDKLRK